MKNRPSLSLIVLLLIPIFFLATSADARVGGGRSMGSRSSRGMGQNRPSPSRQDSGTSPYRATAPVSGNPAQATPSSGGLLRGLGAGIAGGFLGSMLFGGMSHGSGMGGGGGFGLFELIVLGGLAFFLFRWFKNRQQQQMAGGPTNHTSFNYSEPSVPYQATPQMPALNRADNLADILRNSDPHFDEARFKGDRLDDFFRLQAGWATRDLNPIQFMLTLEMYQALSADASALRSAGQINKLDNIAVRETELVEAWEETGRVFATVRFSANLVDYTTDEKTGAVVAGSRTEPIKFQEDWTFSKGIGFTAGNSQWQLTAIEQQAPANIS